MGAGPALSVARWDGAFVVLSGGPHVDVNQAALFGTAGTDTASAVASHVAETGFPCLLAVSSTVSVDVSSVLHDHGWQAMTIPEAIFFAPAIPPVKTSDFEIRRVRTPEDHAAVQRLFVEAHGYSTAFTAGMYGPALLDRPDVGAWLAWDGPIPVSCVFVTRIDRSLGVFDMMTSPGHRRRGAGSAVLTSALADAAGADAGAHTVAFWATPLGRPLYESLGFTLVDDVAVWTLGATPEDLAAVGAL